MRQDHWQPGESFLMSPAPTLSLNRSPPISPSRAPTCWHWKRADCSPDTYYHHIRPRLFGFDNVTFDRGG
jgi:hypothetical protein